MPRPKHLVELTAEERSLLRDLTRTGSAPAQRVNRARILLKADVSADGPGLDDATIASAVEVSRPTVERVRAAFVKGGLEAALQRKAWTGPSRRKLDGVQEAHLAALVCSDPPEGARRWSLTLLADKLVELLIVDSIAPETVRVTLKKMNSSPG